MPITLEMIKELREISGAGILECKNALESANGDMNRARQILREKGLSIVARKAERVAKEGLIEAYIHMGKVGALVELNCETDFVARTHEFKELAHDLAMQVVAVNPLYVRPEDIPQEIIEEQKHLYQTQAADQNKPAHVLEKIVADKLQKFYEEVCLLNQRFIKDEGKTVQDVLNEKIAALGENIVVRRFVRLELGAP